MINTAQPKYGKILRYAKSKGFLTPLWLMPNTDPEGVQRAFQELETFLRDAYLERDLTDIESEEIDDFVWQLKKTYAFKGWDGIAPFLLSIPGHHIRNLAEILD